MSKQNTLHVYLRNIYFDRPTLAYMWVYAVTFVQANVDGDVQMYVSPSSFPITRLDSPGPDLVHRWDGAGALVCSLPTEGLESVRLTTLLIRDRHKARSAGEFFGEAFKEKGAGSDLAAAIETALGVSTGGVGAAAITLLRLAPPVANFISRALIHTKDTIRIYGEGTVLFDSEDDFKDTVRKWSVNHSDKGYFTTLWDFRETSNPSAPLRTLSLPDDLRKRLGIGV